jgi:hypothetical protein
VGATVAASPQALMSIAVITSIEATANNLGRIMIFFSLLKLCLVRYERNVK